MSFYNWTVNTFTFTKFFCYNSQDYSLKAFVWTFVRVNVRHDEIKKSFYLNGEHFKILANLQINWLWIYPFSSKNKIGEIYVK